MSGLCHDCGTQIDEDELTLCGRCRKKQDTKTEITKDILAIDFAIRYPGHLPDLAIIASAALDRVASYIEEFDNRINSLSTDKESNTIDCPSCGRKINLDTDTGCECGARIRPVKESTNECLRTKQELGAGCHDQYGFDKEPIDGR